MIAAKRILLVEGGDDLHVISSFLKHHDVPQIFTIEQKGGIDSLLQVLPVQLKASGIERVGVVIDADVTLAVRWNAVQTTLRRAGFSEIPNEPEETGTIINETDLPVVGVWLMPDNRLPGMLEDFVAYLVPPGNSLFLRANDVVDAIPQDELRFTAAHRSKAVLHTWLAWQADPGTPMGLAITKKYFNAAASEATSFLGWIQRLFVA